MRTHPYRIVISALGLALLAGCSGSSVGGDGDGGRPPTYIGAPDVSISEVSIYQGPKCQIMTNGAPTDCDIPLISNRDALVRVFYTAGPAQVGQFYVARLTLDASDTYEITGSFGTASSEQLLASTANFIVPGTAINQTLSLQVELLQEGEPANDNPAARYPQQGFQQIAVEGPRNTLRIIIAPFAYHADGSGRVPNLSQPRIEEFRQRFLQLYPLSDVEITVRQAYDWYQVIGRDGTGWQQVGMTLHNFRDQDGTPDDVYYYGTFNPAATFSEYCGFGCLLGVTLLNDQPPATGTVDLRMALGVGFDEVAVDTSAHEIGHAHGLRHAPCGQGVQDIDPAYPYSGGLIGVWSWDIVDRQLLAPNEYTDIMGYCDDQWISDYHYIALFNRGKNVNLPWFRNFMVRPVTYRIITVDGQGGAVIQPHTTQRSRPLAGRPIEVFVSSRGGVTTATTGQYFYFDHLPGGWLFVPEPAFEIHTAEFEAEGLWTVAERPQWAD